MAVCRLCQKENATKKCSACKQAWYCNKDCQKAHYKVHKKECAQLAQRGNDAGGTAGSGGKMQLQEEEFEALKTNFDHICDKYNLRSEEKSSEIADFLTDSSSANFDTKAVSEKFGMSMRDANTFLMWIQVGTNFKRDVIDKNAELARQGLI
eukprot:jgi/Ulvmu1/9089/UM005_0184.1